MDRAASQRPTGYEAAPPARADGWCRDWCSTRGGMDLMADADCEPRPFVRTSQQTDRGAVDPQNDSTTRDPSGPPIPATTLVSRLPRTGNGDSSAGYSAEYMSEC